MIIWPENDCPPEELKQSLILVGKRRTEHIAKIYRDVSKVQIVPHSTVVDLLISAYYQGVEDTRRMLVDAAPNSH